MVSETEQNSLRPSSINFFCKVEGLRSQGADFNMFHYKSFIV